MDSIIEKHINKNEDAELFRVLTVINPQKESWIKKQVARMREEATVSEIRVAHFLDEMGAHFVSQAPFFDKEYDAVYIVDFYIPKGHFIIEVDGHSHYTLGKRGQDIARDDYFMREGYRVIRISNLQTESPGKMAILLSEVISRLVLAQKSKEDKANKKEINKKPEGERYEMLKIVVEHLEQAADNDVVVFSTAHHTMAIQILEHRRGKKELGDIRWKIKELKERKNLTVYALFRSKKSTQWMSRHPDNPVSRDYQIYLIKQPSSPIIDIDKEYQKKREAGLFKKV